MVVATLSSVCVVYDMSAFQAIEMKPEQSVRYPSLYAVML